MKFMDLGFQLEAIKHEVFDKVNSIITNSSFIGGEEISLFEEEFSNYIKSNYCLGVGNGTDALEIAISALQLKPGSQIIVPANSFIATSEAVKNTGHEVIFSYIDEETLLITPEKIDEVITENVKAIICVHLYGNPCDLKSLRDYCDNKGIYLIEDCAQAHGASFKEFFVGSSGHIAAWSFYPGKNLGAFGDAGAITTNSEDLYLYSKKIANHGRLDKYDHIMEGRNSRLDNIQAAVLRIKLRYLDEWTDKRIRNANIYHKYFEDLNEIRTQNFSKFSKHVYHLYVIRTQQRNQLIDYLSSNGIGTGIHYPILLPQLRAYSYMSSSVKKDLLTSDLCDTLISLPVGEHLNEDDIQEVAKKIRQFFDLSKQN